MIESKYIEKGRKDKGRYKFFVPDFAKKFKKIRKDLGLSMTAMEQKIDLCRSTISRLELGYYKPSIVTLLKIQAGLGIPVYKWFEEPTPYSLDMSNLTPKQRQMLREFAFEFEKTNEKIKSLERGV